MSLHQPDKYFSRISAIDVDKDLLALGIRFVLLDIDNTILGRGEAAVPRDVGLWMACARDKGIKFCLLTNSWHHQRVSKLSADYELPLVAKALKPLPLGYLAALRKLSAPRKETVMVGDQLLTDVVGAHMVGIRAYLVQPLVEKDLPYMQFMRQVERAMIDNPVPVTKGEAS